MKKVISVCLVILILTAAAPAVLAAPGNSAGAAALIHAETGQLLYGDNADSRMLIASTTKIMTALVVLENCDPDEKISILPEYTGIEGSSMYLRAGGDYTIRDLLYGLLLASGNDAATALACHCGGSIEGFAAMMNDKVARLGLQNTSFENPHGLDGEMQYSTASDLAQITRAAMENEVFSQIVSTKIYTIGEQSYMNHNKLLWNYQGCLGVKTGYTIAAGRTLVSCAERDGMKLICVTLSDPNDWNDHMSLYDWAFSSFEYRNPLPEGEICRVPVISGEISSVGLVPTSGSAILCEKGAELDYTLEAPRFVYAGVTQGEFAGKVTVTLNGEPAGDYELVYSESVAVAEGIKLTPWERFLKAWFLSNKYGFILGGKS